MQEPEACLVVKQHVDPAEQQQGLPSIWIDDNLHSIGETVSTSTVIKTNTRSVTKIGDEWGMRPMRTQTVEQMRTQYNLTLFC
jgi:hypothetical protein